MHKLQLWLKLGRYMESRNAYIIIMDPRKLINQISLKHSPSAPFNSLHNFVNVSIMVLWLVSIHTVTDW